MQQLGGSGAMHSPGNFCKADALRSLPVATFELKILLVSFVHSHKDITVLYM